MTVRLLRLALFALTACAPVQRVRLISTSLKLNDGRFAGPIEVKVPRHADHEGHDFEVNVLLVEDGASASALTTWGRLEAITAEGVRSHEAEEGGMEELVIGCIVSLLARCIVSLLARPHGEELRQHVLLSIQHQADSSIQKRQVREDRSVGWYRHPSV